MSPTRTYYYNCCLTECQYSGYNDGYYYYYYGHNCACEGYDRWYNTYVDYYYFPSCE